MSYSFVYLYNNNNQVENKASTSMLVDEWQYWLWSRMEDIEICVGV